MHDKDEGDRREEPGTEEQQRLNGGEETKGEETDDTTDADRRLQDPPPSLEELVLVLRDQLTELRSRIEALPGGEGAGEGDSRIEATARELESHGEQLTRLSADFDEHRDQLRDYEKALVERIADVDDDRRTTASMLQRAWQGHRDEVDARLRRGSRNIAWVLVIMVIVMCAALLLLYRQVGIDRAPVAHDLSEIKLALAHQSQGGALDSLVEGKLTQLSAALGEISGSLSERSKKQEETVRAALQQERDARADTERRLARALQRLEAQQQALAERLGSAGKGAPTAKAQAEASEVPQRIGESGGASAGSGEGARATPVEPSATQDAVGHEAAGEGTSPSSEVTGPGADEPAHGEGDEAPSLAPSPLVLADRMYAVQLIGFYGFGDLERFVARPGLPQPVYYREETSKGRPLYLVMHSLYEERADAQAALSALPPDLAELAPLIRSLPVGTELWPCRSAKCARSEQ